MQYSLDHYFIEASAGTGKTYTIMEIISHLMESNDLDLKKTLILTFTEKAAGELKERLRKKLKESKNHKIANKVHELDEVVVSTIHGFCKSILEEYPIETGYNDLSVFKDGSVRGQEALYMLEHNRWNDYWSDELQDRIHSSQYFKNKDKLVIAGIQKLLSGRNYGEPDLSKKRKSKVEQPKVDWDKWNHFSSEIRSRKNRIESSIIPYLAKYQVVENRFKKPWEVLNRILEESNPQDNPNYFIAHLFRLLKYYGLSNLEFTLIPTNITKECSTEDKDFFLEFQDWFNSKWNSLFAEVMQYGSPEFFFQETILNAVAIANGEEPEEEWINFDAMISRLEHSLKTNPILKESLQRRFQVGIIDEFQDTDSLQYSIFRQIFLENTNSKSALYLIGDSKQSIYGFRGADIGTYLQAREEIEGAPGNKAQKIILDTNYRSVEELILGYNELFLTESFLRNVSEAGYPNSIEYRRVKAPEPGMRNYALDPEFSEPPIQVIDLTGENPSKIGLIREDWNRFIVSEILSLIESDFRYLKKQNEKWVETPIEYGDIAVLVNSKQVGKNLLNQLKAFGIPATYYQEQGIYQSREMDQILTILICLQDSHNPSSFRKILLTDAFSIDPRHLNRFEEHSIDSREKRLLDLWRKYAESRNFAGLFRSIEQESKIFFTDREFDLAWERQKTNYRQIFRKLLELSSLGKPTLDDLILELKKLKAESKTQEEKALFEKETESSAVQILTVHASKGLEWPVVFLNSLASANPTRHEFYDYPTVDKNLKRTWNISLWAKDNNAFDEYDKNESKRKFYVAMTRPKVRLYLPYFSLETNKNTGKSYPNSYNDIVISGLREIKSGMENNEKDLDRYFRFRDFTDIDLSANVYRESKQNTKSTKDSLSSQNSEESKNDFSHPVYPLRKILPKIQLTSYSTLKDWERKDSSRSKPESGRSTPSPSPEDIYKGGIGSGREVEEIQDSSNEDEHFDTLIAPGAKAGNYLHNILENLDFGKFSDQSIEELYEDEEATKEINHWMEFFGINKTKLARKYQGELSLNKAIRIETIQILWNTLHAKVPVQDGGNIHLKDLPREKTVREMPFHWNAISEKGFLSKQIVKGSIDLVFEWNGKYYLADYKSNTIDKGVSIRSKVEEDENSKYDLQRDIYSYAFFKYLSQCIGSEEQALEKFGGIYYFFLRGMEEGKDSGIYMDIENWSRNRFETIEKRMDDILENWEKNHEY